MLWVPPAAAHDTGWLHVHQLVSQCQWMDRLVVCGCALQPAAGMGSRWTANASALRRYPACLTANTFLAMPAMTARKVRCVAGGQ